MNSGKIKIMILAGVLAAAGITGGCGGRSSSPVTTVPPVVAARGTLRLSGVTARTNISVDGQQVPSASGSVTIELSEGIHSVSVERAGYTLGNGADLTAVAVASGTVTVRDLSFTRDRAPLPEEWLDEGAARTVEALVPEPPPTP